MLKNKYIIGDVHGCYYTLLKLVAKLPNNAELIFVGDLCDKGNFSKEVISFVKDNDFLSIMGNHELLMSKYIEKSIKGEIFSWNSDDIHGGIKTIESYKGNYDLLQEHLVWIDTLPLYMEIENYFITHGYGLPYYKRKDEVAYQKAITSNRIDVDKYRDDWEDTSLYEAFNIFGHSAFEEVERGVNYMGIDTGCVYGRKLTALSLDSLEVIDVEVEAIDINK